MFKFDNSHIFTGYLKQLLASFNLPTCKVYTREFAEYFKQHGKEDPRVVESFDTLSYKSPNTDFSKQRIASRTSYLRGNELYNYFWSYSQNEPALGSKNIRWKKASSTYYDKDKHTPGLTRTLYSLGNVYDTATHEYLGEYLRFLRDYYNVNLMSLYNCFSNKMYNNVYYMLDKHGSASNVSAVVFDSQDSKYRIYAFPVKLFNSYTIAIDCNLGIEMFCGLYDTTLDTSSLGANIISRTYKKVNSTLFRQPFLYNMLDVKYWNFEQECELEGGEYPKFLNKSYATRWDILNREQDLKLFIKVPASNKSSITVLEGDFRGYNDAKYSPVIYKMDNTKFIEGVDEISAGISRIAWEYQQNHSVVNFGDKRTNKIDTNKIPFAPIGKLQLLAFNTGESYPFANRLVEYLCGSAITPIDEIADNIRRAQKVMNDNQHYFKIDGIWEDKMQKIIYDYIINAGPMEAVQNADGKTKIIDKRRGTHPRLGHTSKSALFDILGYVDKDAEKWYASWKSENGKAVVRNSIQNVDIYEGLYDV